MNSNENFIYLVTYDFQFPVNEVSIKVAEWKFINKIRNCVFTNIRATSEIMLTYILIDLLLLP